MLRKEEVVKQLDDLVLRYGYMQEQREPPHRQVVAFLTNAQAAIERLSLPGSPYRTRCEETLGSEYENERYKLDRLMGLVDALRADYAAGAMLPLQQLVRAEVFDDFLEMAEHLLDNGYKDPAAVLVGGVVEQQLRRLCDRAGISTQTDKGHKKADTMNGELVAKGAYGKLDQKAVTSWLDLRNKAAHAEYASYSDEQVRIFLMGVRDFVRRMGG